MTKYYINVLTIVFYWIIILLYIKNWYQKATKWMRGNPGANKYHNLLIKED